MNPAAGARLDVTAPVDSLLERPHPQDRTLSELLARGDFGSGTFTPLDGELFVREQPASEFADLSRDVRADLAEAEK